MNCPLAFGPTLEFAFARQEIGTMLLIGSPLAWTRTNSSLARGDHAHCLRFRPGAPLGVRARGHRSTPQRAGTILGNVGTDRRPVSRRQVHHHRVSKRLRDRASELHGSMGHRDRRYRRANLLRPYALLEPVDTRTEDGIESDHRAD